MIIKVKHCGKPEQHESHPWVGGPIGIGFSAYPADHQERYECDGRPVPATGRAVHTPAILQDGRPCCPEHTPRDPFSEAAQTAAAEAQARVAQRLTPEAKTGRERVLDEASRLVLGDRDEQYGTPKDNFEAGAAMLRAGGYVGPEGRALTAADVAKINILLKMARAVRGDKLDTITDVAGYAACWGEVVEDANGRS